MLVAAGHSATFYSYYLTINVEEKSSPVCAKASQMSLSIPAPLLSQLDEDACSFQVPAKGGAHHI